MAGSCAANPPEIKAYSDISGIGVTAAFLATGWIVVALLIGYYLGAYNPGLDPFRLEGSKTPCQYPNIIDYTFLHSARMLPGLRHVHFSEWFRSGQPESALNKGVMTFSDIQIFSGLTMMISGYIALERELQSYHWQLLIYLVWFSSVTHLAALSFLRNHLANHPGRMGWRILLMFFVVIFLAAAIGLAGHFDWDGDNDNKPSDIALCHFKQKLDPKNDQLEVAEAQENVQVDIDLEHVRSTSHRGALFLAAVSYIQVGVFFSADATPGILQPLRRLAISTFVLNPMLQIVWIHYALWIPHMNWSRPLKMTVYYIALVTLVGTSVAEYVEAPTDGGINEVDTVYLGGITLAPLFFGYAFPILIFHLYYYFRNSTLYLINWLLATIAASLFMEVLWYLVEVQMEKMGVAAVTCFIGSLR
ncbi:hypothetical protein NCS56_01099800 [Fusarium sp. Ph1]|nr:hypothetical protein NCS56_01099800 [Fusarium sp. Ph1]